MLYSFLIGTNENWLYSFLIGTNAIFISHRY